MGIAVQPTTESAASRHPVTGKSEMDVPIVTVDAGQKEVVVVVPPSVIEAVKVPIGQQVVQATPTIHSLHWLP